MQAMKDFMFNKQQVKVSDMSLSVHLFSRSTNV